MDMTADHQLAVAVVTDAEWHYRRDHRRSVMHQQELASAVRRVQYVDPQPLQPVADSPIVIPQHEREIDCGMIG